MREPRKLIKYMDYYGFAVKKIKTNSLIHWTFCDLKRDVYKTFSKTIIVEEEGRYEVVKVKLVEVKP